MNLCSKYIIIMIIGIVILSGYSSIGMKFSESVNSNDLVMNEKNSSLQLCSYRSVIELNWSSIEEPILINESLKKIDIIVEYNIVQGGIFPRLSEFLFQFYYNQKVPVYLEIINSPSWAYITLDRGSWYFEINEFLHDISIFTMTFYLNQDAPSNEQGIVTIKASVPTYNILFIPELKGFEKTFDISFITG